jgi:hypothetical protein
VVIRENFGEFRVEKRSRGGSHGGKSQKSVIFVWSDVVKIMQRFYKSRSDFDNSKTILWA